MRLWTLRAHLDWAETAETRVCVSAFFFFFFTCIRSIFFSVYLLLRLLFINSSRKVWLFFTFSAQISLFMDLQISLLNNFFIKNGSHSTIHTFKNYFAIVFFNFQFQLLVFSCIQMDHIYVKCSWYGVNLASTFFFGYFLLLMSSLVIYVSVLSLTEKMVSAICYASNNVFYLFINICKH